MFALAAHISSLSYFVIADLLPYAKSEYPLTDFPASITILSTSNHAITQD